RSETKMASAHATAAKELATTTLCCGKTSGSTVILAAASRRWMSGRRQLIISPMTEAAHGKASGSTKMSQRLLTSLLIRHASVWLLQQAMPLSEAMERRCQPERVPVRKECLEEATYR